MASIEKIVEGGDGVITVYFNSPYTVELNEISAKQPSNKIGPGSTVKTNHQFRQQQL